MFCQTSFFDRLPALLTERTRTNVIFYLFDYFFLYGKKIFEKLLTKRTKSFIFNASWDTKFIRGSMQIFPDHPNAG